MNPVPQNREQHRNSPDQNAKIHAARTHRRRGWPEAPKPQQHEIDARKYIVYDAEDTWNPPRAPAEIAGTDYLLRAVLTVRLDLTRDAATPEKERTAEQVG